MTLALLLALALILDAIFGEPEWLWSRLPHPAVLMGRLVGLLDRHLNRNAYRRLKGVVALCILVGSSGVTAAALALLGPVAETIVAAILLAHRSLVQHVGAVAAGLRENLPAGRRAVSMIVSRDTGDMTDSAVARSAIESAAENFSDGVIAPAFWFLIAGLPGILIYKMVNTADSMIGYRSEKYEAFGWAAARTDDLLNLVPARLSALLIALPAGHLDLKGVRADAGLHRSPNAGWPEAAMARVLGIALSGPRSYAGITRTFPWVNEDGRQALTPKDIDASLTMLWKAWGGLMALCAAIALFTL
ncbi:MAG: adenosylcobinamide-phosphate synthase CbiB [Pseudomonadota bacterium]